MLIRDGEKRGKEVWMWGERVSGIWKPSFSVKLAICEGVCANLSLKWVVREVHFRIEHTVMVNKYMALLLALVCSPFGWMLGPVHCWRRFHSTVHQGIFLHEDGMQLPNWQRNSKWWHPQFVSWKNRFTSSTTRGRQNKKLICVSPDSFLCCQNTKTGKSTQIVSYVVRILKQGKAHR